MKFIYFLLLCMFFSCCHTTEKSATSKKDDVKNTPPTLPTMSDSLMSTKSEEDRVYMMNKMESRVAKSAPITKSAPIEREEKYYTRTIPTKSRSITRYDSVSTNGSTAYSIPKEMKVRDTYTVFVKISKSNILVKQYKNDNVVSTATIPVTETMEVNLIDDSPEDNKSFSIVKDGSSNIQEVDNESTTWSWTVIPLRSGEHNLSIVISTIRNGIPKDVVYKDTVKVKIDIKNQVLFFIKSYWQYICSSIGAIFAFFWGKRKIKNRKSK